MSGFVQNVYVLVATVAAFVYLLMSLPGAFVTGLAKGKAIPEQPESTVEALSAHNIFSRINVGMTYDTIAALIGGAGVLESFNESGAQLLTTYQWTVKSGMFHRKTLHVRFENEKACLLSW